MLSRERKDVPSGNVACIPVSAAPIQLGASLRALARPAAELPRGRHALLHAALEKHADRLDKFTEEYFAFFQRLKQLGIRGMIAVSTDDPDLFEPPDDEE